MKRISCLIQQVLISLFFLFPGKGFGSHHMGGEITWRCLPSGEYKFSVITYRDCNGTTALDPIDVVTDAPIATFECNLILTEEISNAGFYANGDSIYPDCAAGGMTPFTGLVQKLTYESDAISLPAIPATGFTFTHGFCCLSLSISNISNAGFFGYQLKTVMYPYSGWAGSACNDQSPYFIERPVNSHCMGYPIKLNSLMVDPEQDSLVYSWDQPIDELGNIVQFTPGYSITSQFPNSFQNPNNIPATLNTHTGEINLTSFTSGDFYYSLVIKAYRCGELVSETHRSSQVAIRYCIGSGGNNTAPVISAPFPDPVSGLYTSYTDTVYAGDLVLASFTIADNDTFLNGNAQQITIEAQGELFGLNYTNPNIGCQQPPCATFNNSLPQVASSPYNLSFTWQTSCDHVNPPPGSCSDNSVYTFTVRATDNFAYSNGVTIATVRIVVLPTPQPDNPELKCSEVLPNGGVKLTWQPPSTVTFWSSFQSYIIYASTAPNGTYIAVDTITSSFFTTSYTHAAASLQSLFGITANEQSIYYKMVLVAGCGASATPSAYSNRLETIYCEAVLDSSNQAAISWNAPSVPPVSSNYGLYEVYRKLQSGNWTLAGTSPSLSFTDPFTQGLCDEWVYYRIRLPDSTGCLLISSVDSVLVNDPVSLSTISPPNPGICQGASLVLSAAYGQTYLWNTGAITQTISVSAPGTYTVTVTEPGGCSGIGSTVVVMANTPSPSISGNNAVCQGDTANLSVNPSFLSYLWNTGAVSQNLQTTAAGMYTVTVTDAYGCTATDTVEVTVNPMPIAVLSASGPTSFCSGDSVVLSVPPLFSNYQWYRANILLAQGTTMSSFSAKARGWYRCFVTDNIGCSNFSSTITVKVPCINPPTVHDKLIGGETEKDFVVYPNPSSGIFLLEGTAWTKDQLLLTDIAGRRVEFELLYENEEQAQISIKSPGVYLLISTVSGQTVRLVSLP